MPKDLFVKQLESGLTIIHKQMSSETVTITFSVHVGSIMENSSEAGLSHFLEHLLFEGTKKRPTSRAIANEIERLGGEFNAATSHERTYYYVKIAKKHFTVALDILYDMFRCSTFVPKIVEKERKVILDEVNMINDNPRHYQWILFYKALFGSHPARLPVYGDIAVLKKITRVQILSYFRKWYVPENITIVVAGDVPKALFKVEKKCSHWHGPVAPYSPAHPMDANRKSVLVEKKKLAQSYLMVGYKTVPRSHKDSYVFDVIAGILGRGQSGWLFDEIRAKRGLCYNVRIDYDGAKTYGALGIYAGTHKKNIAKVQKLMLAQLDRLKKVSKTAVDEAKTYVAGSLALHRENTADVAEELADWHNVASVSGYRTYLSKIKKVSAADVRRVAKKYFTKDFTKVVLEQK